MEMQSNLHRASKKMYELVGRDAREAYMEAYTFATKGGAQAPKAQTLFSSIENKLLETRCAM